MRNKKKSINLIIEFYHNQYQLIQELTELINIDPENKGEINSILSLIEYEHQTFLENNPELANLYDLKAHIERLKIVLHNTSISIPKK